MRAIEREPATARASRWRPALAAELSPGDSIAVNGVCLTAVEPEPTAPSPPT